MAKLNDKDFKIMDFIYREMEDRGFPPTVREICDEVGLTSTATVHARIKKLVDMGYIIKENSKNRSIRVNSEKYCPEGAKATKHISEETNDKYLDVPILGKVTAGIPITAVEQSDCDTFPLPMDFAKNKNLFMLNVSGESMINAAILDGDLIIVQQQPNANNGDIVVAMVNDNEATVKTFYKEKGHFRLQPENDSMDPIIVDQVSILGKVVGVFRKL